MSVDEGGGGGMLGSEEERPAPSVVEDPAHRPPPPYNPTPLSTDDFHRLQLQLLELRTKNCELGEENKRMKNQHSQYEERLKAAGEEGGRSMVGGLSKVLSLGVGGGRKREGLEEEIHSLRRKLATQEEEFRLQQATLMEELNRIVKRADDLELQVACKKSDVSFSMSADDSEQSKQEQPLPNRISEERNEELTIQLNELKANNDTLTSELHAVRQQAEESAKKQKAELETALAENTTLRNKISGLEEVEQKYNETLTEGDMQKKQIDTMKIEAGEVVKNLKQEIGILNEKFRRKQESYVQLNKEKESQYEEYRKSLDGIVQKKDTEIEGMAKEMSQLREKLKTIHQWEDTAQVWKGERRSLEEAILREKASASEVREQNEAFQIQLQETHSANDCLSAQLQDARKEVIRIQEQSHEYVETADKRKTLLDDMSLHLEKTKEGYEASIVQMKEEFSNKILFLEKQLYSSKEESGRVAELEGLLEAERERGTGLEGRAMKAEEEVTRVEGERRREKEEWETETTRKDTDFSATFDQLTSSLQQQTTKLNQEIEEAKKDKDICMLSVAKLKQTVIDKDEELKLVEKKQTSLIKDLKRQIHSEKKRGDRMQEKMTELKTELARNKSPGFEEIKASELIDTVGVKQNVETGSISSWSVVSNNRKPLESDRRSARSGGGDNDSNSSVTMDSENQDILTRLTSLQNEKFDLQERVNMLEESNSAMAEDLVNKSAIIGQYVKDKTILGSHAPGSPTTEKLPGGIRKMMEFVKMDQSAADIREMNRRLQVMLEESLTKNMHLQEDLELMSQHFGGSGSEK